MSGTCWGDSSYDIDFSEFDDKCLDRFDFIVLPPSGHHGDRMSEAVVADVREEKVKRVSKRRNRGGRKCRSQRKKKLLLQIKKAACALAGVNYKRKARSSFTKFDTSLKPPNTLYPGALRDDQSRESGLIVPGVVLDHQTCWENSLVSAKTCASDTDIQTRKNSAKSATVEESSSEKIHSLDNNIPCLQHLLPASKAWKFEVDDETLVKSLHIDMSSPSTSKGGHGLESLRVTYDLDRYIEEQEKQGTEPDTSTAETDPEYDALYECAFNFARTHGYGFVEFVEGREDLDPGEEQAKALRRLRAKRRRRELAKMDKASSDRREKSTNPVRVHIPAYDSSLKLGVATCRGMCGGRPRDPGDFSMNNDLDTVMESARKDLEEVRKISKAISTALSSDMWDSVNPEKMKSITKRGAKSVSPRRVSSPCKPAAHRTRHTSLHKSQSFNSKERTARIPSPRRPQPGTGRNLARNNADDMLLKPPKDVKGKKGSAHKHRSRAKGGHHRSEEPLNLQAMHSGNPAQQYRRIVKEMCDMIGSGHIPAWQGEDTNIDNVTAPKSSTAETSGVKQQASGSPEEQKYSSIRHNLEETLDGCRVDANGGENTNVSSCLNVDDTRDKTRARQDTIGAGASKSFLPSVSHRNTSKKYRLFNSLSAIIFRESKLASTRVAAASKEEYQPHLEPTSIECVHVKENRPDNDSKDAASCEQSGTFGDTNKTASVSAKVAKEDNSGMGVGCIVSADAMASSAVVSGDETSSNPHLLEQTSQSTKVKLEPCEGLAGDETEAHVTSIRCARNRRNSFAPSGSQITLSSGHLVSRAWARAGSCPDLALNSSRRRRSTPSQDHTRPKRGSPQHGDSLGCRLGGSNDAGLTTMFSPAEGDRRSLEISHPRDLQEERLRESSPSRYTNLGKLMECDQTLGAGAETNPQSLSGVSPDTPRQNSPRRRGMSPLRHSAVVNDEDLAPAIPEQVETGQPLPISPRAQVSINNNKANDAQRFEESTTEDVVERVVNLAGPKESPVGSENSRTAGEYEEAYDNQTENVFELISCVTKFEEAESQDSNNNARHDLGETGARGEHVRSLEKTGWRLSDYINQSTAPKSYMLKKHMAAVSSSNNNAIPSTTECKKRELPNVSATSQRRKWGPAQQLSPTYQETPGVEDEIHRPERALPLYPFPNGETIKLPALPVQRRQATTPDNNLKNETNLELPSTQGGPLVCHKNTYCKHEDTPVGLGADPTLSSDDGGGFRAWKTNTQPKTVPVTLPPAKGALSRNSRSLPKAASGRDHAGHAKNDHSQKRTRQRDHPLNRSYVISHDGDKNGDQALKLPVATCEKTADSQSTNFPSSSSVGYRKDSNQPRCRQSCRVFSPATNTLPACIHSVGDRKLAFDVKPKVSLVSPEFAGRGKSYDKSEDRMRSGLASSSSDEPSPREIDSHRSRHDLNNNALKNVLSMRLDYGPHQRLSCKEDTNCPTWAINNISRDANKESSMAGSCPVFVPSADGDRTYGTFNRLLVHAWNDSAWINDNRSNNASLPSREDKDRYNNVSMSSSSLVRQVHELEREMVSIVQEQYSPSVATAATTSCTAQREGDRGRNSNEAVPHVDTSGVHDLCSSDVYPHDTLERYICQSSFDYRANINNARSMNVSGSGMGARDREHARRRRMHSPSLSAEDEAGGPDQDPGNHEAATQERENQMELNEFPQRAVRFAESGQPGQTSPMPSHNVYGLSSRQTWSTMLSPDPVRRRVWSSVNQQPTQSQPPPNMTSLHPLGRNVPYCPTTENYWQTASDPSTVAPSFGLFHPGSTAGYSQQRTLNEEPLQYTYNNGLNVPSTTAGASNAQTEGMETSDVQDQKCTSCVQGGQFSITQREQGNSLTGEVSPFAELYRHLDSLWVSSQNQVSQKLEALSISMNSRLKQLQSFVERHVPNLRSTSRLGQDADESTPVLHHRGKQVSHPSIHLTREATKGKLPPHGLPLDTSKYRRKRGRPPKGDTARNNSKASRLVESRNDTDVSSGSPTFPSINFKEMQTDSSAKLPSPSTSGSQLKPSNAATCQSGKTEIKNRQSRARSAPTYKSMRQWKEEVNNPVSQSCALRDGSVTCACSQTHSRRCRRRRAAGEPGCNMCVLSKLEKIYKHRSKSRKRCPRGARKQRGTVKSPGDKRCRRPTYKAIKRRNCKEKSFIITTRPGRSTKRSYMKQRASRSKQQRTTKGLHISGRGKTSMQRRPTRRARTVSHKLTKQRRGTSKSQRLAKTRPINCRGKSSAKARLVRFRSPRKQRTPRRLPRKKTKATFFKIPKRRNRVSFKLPLTSVSKIGGRRFTSPQLFPARLILGRNGISQKKRGYLCDNLSRTMQRLNQYKENGAERQIPKIGPYCRYVAVSQIGEKNPCPITKVSRKRKRIPHRPLRSSCGARSKISRSRTTRKTKPSRKSRKRPPFTCMSNNCHSDSSTKKSRRHLLRHPISRSQKNCRAKTEGDSKNSNRTASIFNWFTRNTNGNGSGAAFGKMRDYFTKSIHSRAEAMNKLNLVRRKAKADLNTIVEARKTAVTYKLTSTGYSSLIHKLRSRYDRLQTRSKKSVNLATRSEDHLVDQFRAVVSCCPREKLNGLRHILQGVPTKSDKKETTFRVTASPQQSGKPHVHRNLRRQKIIAANKMWGLETFSPDNARKRNTSTDKYDTLDFHSNLCPWTPRDECSAKVAFQATKSPPKLPGPGTHWDGHVEADTPAPGAYFFGCDCRSKLNLTTDTAANSEEPSASPEHGDVLPKQVDSIELNRRRFVKRPEDVSRNAYCCEMNIPEPLDFSANRSSCPLYVEPKPQDHIDIGAPDTYGSFRHCCGAHRATPRDNVCHCWSSPSKDCCFWQLQNRDVHFSPSPIYCKTKECNCFRDPSWVNLCQCCSRGPEYCIDREYRIQPFRAGLPHRLTQKDMDMLVSKDRSSLPSTSSSDSFQLMTGSIFVGQESDGLSRHLYEDRHGLSSNCLKFLPHNSMPTGGRQCVGGANTLSSGQASNAAVFNAGRISHQQCGTQSSKQDSDTASSSIAYTSTVSHKPPGRKIIEPAECVGESEKSSSGKFKTYDINKDRSNLHRGKMLPAEPLLGCPKFTKSTSNSESAAFEGTGNLHATICSTTTNLTQDDFDSHNRDKEHTSTNVTEASDKPAELTPCQSCENVGELKQAELSEREEVSNCNLGIDQPVIDTGDEVECCSFNGEENVHDLHQPAILGHVSSNYSNSYQDSCVHKKGMDAENVSMDTLSTQESKLGKMCLALGRQPTLTLRYRPLNVKLPIKGVPEKKENIVNTLAASESIASELECDTRSIERSTFEVTSDTKKVQECNQGEDLKAHSSVSLQAKKCDTTTSRRLQTPENRRFNQNTTSTATHSQPQAFEDGIPQHPYLVVNTPGISTAWHSIPVDKSPTRHFRTSSQNRMHHQETSFSDNDYHSCLPHEDINMSPEDSCDINQVEILNATYSPELLDTRRTGVINFGESKTDNFLISQNHVILNVQEGVLPYESGVQSSSNGLLVGDNGICTTPSQIHTFEDVAIPTPCDDNSLLSSENTRFNSTRDYRHMGIWAKTTAISGEAGVSVENTAIGGEVEIPAQITTIGGEVGMHRKNTSVCEEVEKSGENTAVGGEMEKSEENSVVGGEVEKSEENSVVCEEVEKSGENTAVGGEMGKSEESSVIGERAMIVFLRYRQQRHASLSHSDEVSVSSLENNNNAVLSQAPPPAHSIISCRVEYTAPQISSHPHGASAHCSHSSEPAKRTLGGLKTSKYFEQSRPQHWRQELWCRQQHKVQHPSNKQQNIQQHHQRKEKQPRRRPSLERQKINTPQQHRVCLHGEVKTKSPLRHGPVPSCDVTIESLPPQPKRNPNLPAAKYPAPTAIQGANTTGKYSMSATKVLQASLSPVSSVSSHSTSSVVTEVFCSSIPSASKCSHQNHSICCTQTTSITHTISRSTGTTPLSTSVTSAKPAVHQTFQTASVFSSHLNHLSAAVSINSPSLSPYPCPTVTPYIHCSKIKPVLTPEAFMHSALAQGHQYRLLTVPSHTLSSSLQSLDSQRLTEHQHQVSHNGSYPLMGSPHTHPRIVCVSANRKRRLHCPLSELMAPPRKVPKMDFRIVPMNIHRKRRMQRRAEWQLRREIRFLTAREEEKKKERIRREGRRKGTSEKRGAYERGFGLVFDGSCPHQACLNSRSRPHPSNQGNSSDADCESS